MLFSAYNSSGVRLLSNAYAEALGVVRAGRPRPLSEPESLLLSRQLTRNLMDAHDDGERDPEALMRAALQGVPIPSVANPEPEARLPR